MSKGNATAFDAGVEAAFNGREVWMNPHAVSTGSIEAFNAWLAGWCFGKQNSLDGSETQQ